MLRSACNSSCHSFPSCQLPSEFVSLSSVPMPSIDLTFVPISLGFTTVLTDDIVRSFRNTECCSSLSSTFAHQEELINVTQGTRCTIPSQRVTSPVSVRVSRDVFLMQISSSRDSDHVFFFLSQRFLGTCQIWKCW